MAPLLAFGSAARSQESAAAESLDPWWRTLPLESAEDRWTALFVLEDQRLDDAEAWSRLLALEKDGSFRAAVVRGLGRVGGVPLWQLLRKVLEREARPESRSDLVRSAEALAVGLMRDPLLLEPLARRAWFEDVVFAAGLVGRLPRDAYDRRAVLDAEPEPIGMLDDTPLRYELGAEWRSACLIDDTHWQAKALALLTRLRAGFKGIADSSSDILDLLELEPVLDYLGRHRERPPAKAIDLFTPWVRGSGGGGATRWESSDGDRDIVDRIHAAAARALARCEGTGTKESALLAAAFLESGPRVVQLERLHAIGLIQADAAADALDAALRDEDPFIRRAALRALAAVSARDGGIECGRRLVEPVRELERKDPVRMVQAAAVVALASIGPDRFLIELPRIRESYEWEIRAAAAAGLRHFEWGRLGSGLQLDETSYAIMGLAKDLNPRVRVAALESIRAKNARDTFALGRVFPGQSFVESRRSRRFTPRVTEDGDPAVLGTWALVAADFERSRRMPLISFFTPRDELFAREFLEDVVKSLPPGEARALGCVLDLAEVANREDAKAALLRLAGSPEIGIRSRAREILRKRGLETPPVPELPDAERKRVLARCRESAKAVLANWNATAIVKTSRGSMTLRLFASWTPATVANFARLAESHFYEGLVFHRVEPEAIVETGCPRGDGWGGPGWTIRDEISEHAFRRGTVGMTTWGPDTGGSQWFIVPVDRPDLDGTCTAFGEVVDGFEVLDALMPGDPILSVTIER